jgi:hypothetical protein
MSTLYNCDVSFSHWDEEAIEAGESDNKGMADELEGYSLAGILEILNHAHIWECWSDTQPGPNSALEAQIEEHPRTGVKSCHSAVIRRADGLPLTVAELSEISDALRIDYCPPTVRTGE